MCCRGMEEDSYYVHRVVKKVHFEWCDLIQRVFGMHEEAIALDHRVLDKILDGKWNAASTFDISTTCRITVMTCRRSFIPLTSRQVSPLLPFQNERMEIRQFGGVYGWWWQLRWFIVWWLPWVHSGEQEWGRQEWTSGTNARRVWKNGFTAATMNTQWSAMAFKLSPEDMDHIHLIIRQHSVSFHSTTQLFIILTSKTPTPAKEQACTHDFLPANTWDATKSSTMGWL